MLWQPSRFFLALVVLCQALFIPASADDQFFMGGKPVPKEFYDAGLLVNQGTVLLRGNKNKEAADMLAQAVHMAPNFAEAHHDYALALAKLGKTDDALKEFQLAIKLNPDLDSAWLSLGGLYQSNGRLPDAIAAYREFVTRFPQHPDTPKIATLMQSLQKEQLSHGTDKPQSTSDDYFDEATRMGPSRWPASRMPIKIFVHDGTDVPGYKPSYERILRQSFSDWAKASQGLIQFEYAKDPSVADIECFWESDGRKLNSAAESGETRETKDSKGILHCTMRLLTIPTLPEMPITENRMRQITLHEIGHALGFTGHTTNPRDAMFFSSTVEDQWKDLSQRDANTIVRLYSQN